MYVINLLFILAYACMHVFGSKASDMTLFLVELGKVVIVRGRTDGCRLVVLVKFIACESLEQCTCRVVFLLLVVLTIFINCC